MKCTNALRYTVWSILLLLSGCKGPDYFISKRNYKANLKRNTHERAFSFSRTSTDEDQQGLINELKLLGVSVDETTSNTIFRIYLKPNRPAKAEVWQQVDQLMAEEKIFIYGGLLRDRRRDSWMVLNNKLMVHFSQRAELQAILNFLSEHQLEEDPHYFHSSQHLYHLPKGSPAYRVLEIAVKLYKSGLADKVILDGYSGPPDFDI
ncbi:MAG: hypothetical protein AAFO94_06280 [Bacteroidota bacterium]